MDKKIAVKLFEDRNIRAVWDEDKEDWWFSVVDIEKAEKMYSDFIEKNKKANEYFNSFLIA